MLFLLDICSKVFIIAIKFHISAPKMIVAHFNLQNKNITAPHFKMKNQNTFVLLEKIGNGSYGEVHKAFDSKRSIYTQNQDIYVALKRFKFDSNSGVEHTSLREIVNLTRLDHPNIVELLEVIKDDDGDVINYSLIFPFYETDLAQLMQSQNEIILQLVRNDQSSAKKLMMKQLLSGLNEIHRQLILHRDLKPSNILLDQRGNIKIADFGLSKPLFTADNNHTSEVMTINYRCPEILLGDKAYSWSADIWGLGLVFYYILVQEHLFNETTQIGMLFKIFQIFGTPHNNHLTQLPLFNCTIFPKFKSKEDQLIQRVISQSDSKCSEVISKMLKMNPNERFEIRQLMQLF